MHEIEQNDSAHPYINYSPYSPPRQYIQCEGKKSHFCIKYFSFEVWWEKLKCDVCLLWLVLKTGEVLAVDALKALFETFSVSQIARKNLLLFATVFISLFASLRSSLKHQSLNIRWIHLPPFLIISADTEQLEQTATKTNFIIISMSCLCSSTGHLPPLWCPLPTVNWHCSYLNYKWKHNLPWWC